MGRVATPEQFAARFWARVDKSPGHGPNGDCWPWTGAILKPTRTSTGGYGHLTYDGADLTAHRVALTLSKGPIPDGKIAMHSCDYRPCCNPDHLIAGTKAENTADMMAKGRANPARGDRNGRRTRPERTARGERAGHARLTESQVAAMRAAHAAGVLVAQISRDYGLPYMTANSAIRGVTWTHVPMPVALEVSAA